MTAAAEAVSSLWWAGVNSVRGDVAVARALVGLGAERPDRIIAVGKAAVPMTKGALEHFGGGIPALAVTKYGHGQSTGAVHVIEAGHPVPDENSLRGGAALVAEVAACPLGSSLLVLVSGGASSLAEQLVMGYTLEMLRSENEHLLASGLAIEAINARRRHSSQIKGGGLLSGFAGRSVLTLAISDVRGDDVATIGSGIGAKPPGVDFAYTSHIIASNNVARSAVALAAKQRGLIITESDECLYDDVNVVARRLGQRLRRLPPGVAVYGGEPTVRLGKTVGVGGRNQALAMLLAREIDGIDGICVIVGATDGTDGPTSAAGGIVDGNTWRRIPGAANALAEADSGTWLERAGCLWRSGPTGTNVMDLIVVYRTP